MNASMTFTESAADYLKQAIDNESGCGFRLTIKKTGCSGYSYAPTIVTEIIPTDVLIELKQGINVYLDPTWLHLLHGLQVDYVADNTGLKQKRLIFHNPNETSRCGCGESFHVEK